MLVLSTFRTALFISRLAFSLRVPCGLAASLLWLLGGRTAGVSGILGGVVPPLRTGWEWRALFLGGLLAGGLLLFWLAPNRLGVPLQSPGVLIAAGLLVGFGTRLAGGCTSGHGICGIGRLSRASLVATLVFMATGMITVAVMRGLMVQP